MHPKDKVADSKTTNCLYQIPCKSCNQTYVSKTGTIFGTKLEEQRRRMKLPGKRRERERERERVNSDRE